MIVRRVAPPRLATLGILAFAVPLWLLPVASSAWIVMAALFVATLFTPLVNGLLIGVLTARTPEALRPKVMTAILSINTLAAPLGFLLAGQILERWGVDPDLLRCRGRLLRCSRSSSLPSRSGTGTTPTRYQVRPLRPDRRKGDGVAPRLRCPSCLRSRHRTRTPRRATSRARSPSLRGRRGRRALPTMLGATGTGKTATMAWINEQGPAADARHRPQQDAGRAALQRVPRVLPAQRGRAAFVSYYDYYQPEAYVPQADLYIEKDSSSQNDDIARLRLAATSSLFTRRDVVVVASVSRCIYGLGSPELRGAYAC